VDAQAGALGEDEELGVEEPGVVLDRGHEQPGGVAANRLEAALGVREPRPEGEVQEPVVDAGDELPSDAADHAGSGGQTRADREIAVAGDEGGDQREHGPEVGREIDVHVAEDVGLAGQPGCPQRPATALLGEPEQCDTREAGGERRGDPRRFVGARVIGDHDPPGEGDLVGEVVVEAAYRGDESGLLVVDGKDDVDARGGHGHSVRPAAEPRLWPC
jgi:hypothetical protein